MKTCVRISNKKIGKPQKWLDDLRQKDEEYQVRRNQHYLKSGDTPEERLRPYAGSLNGR